MKVLMAKPRTSWPVSIGWMMLSVSMATTLIISFNASVWFYRDGSSEPNSTSGLGTGRAKDVLSFGLSGYCSRVRYAYLRDVTVCRSYGGGGGRFHFAYIPDGWWKSAYVLFGCGSVFFCYSAICAVVCQFLPNVNLRKSVSHYTGYVQLVGVVLTSLALLLYPVGLGNDFDRKYCGPEVTRSYHSGLCQIGWTYTLAIVSTIVSVYCPYLSRYTYYYDYEVEFPHNV
ncbi:Uncharacterised protein g9054 [Pycnogonum litorale]